MTLIKEIECIIFLLLKSFSLSLSLSVRYRLGPTWNNNVKAINGNIIAHVHNEQCVMVIMKLNDETYFLLHDFF